MILKNLFASIGILISSMFTPIKASANVFGDLLTNNMLYPSFEFDSVWVQNGSNIAFASYPNLFDLSSNNSTWNDTPVTTSKIGTASDVSGSVQYIQHSKFLSQNTGDGRWVVGDAFSPVTVNGNPFKNSSLSATSWNTVDLIYSANDIIISQTDLSSIAFNVYSLRSNYNNGSLDYQISFTLKSKTTSVGEYAISSYNFSRTHTSIDLNSMASSGRLTFGGQNIFMHSISLFEEFDFSEEEDYIWLTDFKLHIGYSGSLNGSIAVNAFGFDMPYYTSNIYVEKTSLNNWLVANGLDASTFDCPTCQECLTCPPTPICPGGNNVNVDFTSWIATAVGGFLGFELFPNFSLIGVISIFIMISVVIWVLKVLAGG